ncbi:MAG: PQQ-binding-like beta-propeller repeat protein [Luteitalea sp.]|nr:PQQ-binding-like beta-propeller repeat protein [Luteitalea sp.]
MTRSSRYLLAVVLCVGVVIPPVSVGGAAGGGAWTQWGGPHRNFMVEAQGLATDWPAAGPRQLWSRALGEGHSSILNEDGRLYTMYRPLSAAGRSEEEAIVALNAATGQTIWEHKYASPTSGVDFSAGAGPHSTPLIVGDRIFAAGSRRELFALDKQTGRVLWSHDLMKEFGAPEPDRGFAPSPIAFGETIILPVGGPEQFVMAFEQRTGAVAWKKHSFSFAPGSPVLIGVDGQQQLVVFGGDDVAGINPANGDLLWRHPHKTDYGLNISTPVWGSDNLLFLSSAYNNGSRVLQLTQTDGKTSVKELWFNNRMRVHIGTVIRLGDYAYGASGDFGPSFITAINVKTGEIAWRDRSFARSQFLYADDRIVILDEDGALGIATLSPKGLKVHARADVLTKISWTPPTLVGTRLYVRDRANIVALELGSSS